MLRKTAHRLASLLVSNGLVSEGYLDVYIYGFELLLSAALTTLAVFLTSIFSGMLFPGFIFSIVFCGLRAFAGGYHCKTYLGCVSTSLSIFLIMVLSCHLMPSILLIFSLVLMVLSLPVLFLFAPFDHVTKGEPNRKRWVVRILLFIGTGLCAMFLFIGIDILAFSIAWAVFAVTVLVLAGMLEKERS